MGGGAKARGGKDAARGRGSKGKSKGAAPQHNAPEVEGAGQGRGTGRGHGKGKGAGEAKFEEENVAKGDNEDVGSTRALVNALRSFSEPRWWLIGTEAPLKARRRVKPDVFEQTCTDQHSQMVKAYESTMRQDSEQRWLRKVATEGTAGDRVASLTMLIQVCPVLSTGWIKALLNMAGKIGRSDGAMAVDALKDLFINSLLPDRKLRTLAQMDPLSPKGQEEEPYLEYCVVAYFEDYLKTVFAAFVQMLGEAGHSSVAFFKTKAIRTAHDLLAAKPEQERALMGMLVNKFGDTASKVSSNASFALTKLVKAHPGMKLIVAKEVEAFLMRPNVTQKSQYFAILHLSEMTLSRKTDAALAAQLIRIYVTRLEEALRAPKMSQKAIRKRRTQRWQLGNSRRHQNSLQSDDNRLVRTLIQGIQRAMPYLDTIGTVSPLDDSTLEALFKVCHTVSAFSTRIAILSLLHRCMSRGSPSDRFYRLLHEQVAEFDLFASKHRYQAFMLIKRCVPDDNSFNRGVAMGRRLLQVGANAEAPVAAASLSVLRELLVARRLEMKSLLGTVDAEVKPPGAGGDDEAEEHFVDDDTAAATAEAAKDTNHRYEPLAREPKFARAQNTPLWELHALAQHVHPFVANGASNLLTSQSFKDVGPNPFEDFSVQELCEQYVTASRTTRSNTHRARDNQRRGGQVKKVQDSEEGAEDEDGEKAKKPKEERVAFDSQNFLKKKNHYPHERFFVLYYNDPLVQRQVQRKRDSRRKREDEFDEETHEQTKDEGEADEEEADEFFDQHLEEMMPKWDGDADVDDDDDDEDDDDEDDFAFGDMAEEQLGSDAALSGDEADSGSDGEGGPGSDNEAVGEPGASPRGAKRKVEAEPQTRLQRVKALKKQHSGSKFATAEDFEELLAEDFS